MAVINVWYTFPTIKIKSVDDYKTRVEEIFSWQIKDTLLGKVNTIASCFKIGSFLDIFLSLFMLCWIVCTLPFTVAYIILCLTELIVDTLLLPLCLIPVVRILPIIAIFIVWDISMVLGIFGGAALVRY